jgi:hypothetical protein
MFSHERSLVKRLEGKPFTLLGVNSDKDRQECLNNNVKQQISWRSFWNGKDGTGGPISAEWNVIGWPTLFIIDHKGVIRHRFVGNPGDEKLDQFIDDLIKDAEKDAKGP